METRNRAGQRQSGGAKAGGDDRELGEKNKTEARRRETAAETWRASSSGYRLSRLPSSFCPRTRSSLFNRVSSRHEKSYEPARAKILAQEFSKVRVSL